MMNSIAEAQSNPPCASPAATIHEPWSLTHVSSHLRLWLMTIAGLAVDLGTKHWAFSHIRANAPRDVIPGVLSLQLSLNPGALFGIGAGFAPIFVGASVLALLFVLFLFANTAASRWSMHIALGLVLGGALGNLYDRATQEAFVAYTPQGRDIGKLVQKTPTHVVLTDFPDGGRQRAIADVDADRSGLQPVVRDFIKVEAHVAGLPLWPWIFNVADALLVFGVIILLINFWFDRRSHGEHGDSSSLTSSQPTIGG